MRLLPLLFALVLSSCATHALYHVEADVKREFYTETPPGNAPSVTTTGTGVQLGISERLKWITTRISAYVTDYAPFNYYALSQTITPSNYGIDAAIGFNLWIFRPQVAYKLDWMNATVINNGSGIGTLGVNTVSIFSFYLGGGLGIEIPVSRGFRIVAECNYETVINPQSASITEIITLAGIRVGGWGSGEPKERQGGYGSADKGAE